MLWPRRCGALPSVNMWAFAALVIGLSAAARGAGSGAAEMAVPPAAEVFRTYEAIDGWLRAWAAPEQPEKIDPSGASGISVTLRLAGEVIGRGESIRDDGLSAWHAARTALTEARGRFPVERDALEQERILEMVPRITLDVQVAGAWKPTVGADWASATAELSPGIDGVGLRAGERVGAVFPGTMLWQGRLPAQALELAAGEAGLPPVPLAQLRAAEGARTFRFVARHLVQVRPGEGPVFVQRGGDIVGLARNTPKELIAFAARMADHLTMHLWPGDEPRGLRGTYDPVNDRFDPPDASPFEQALAALALHRAATAPGMPADAARRWAEAAKRVLADLARVAPGEAQPTESLTVCAMLLIAADTMKYSGEAAPGEWAGLRDAAVSRVRAAFSEDNGWDEAIPSAERAVIALALVTLDEGEPGTRMGAAACRSLLRDTAANELVNLMPWLGWALLEMSEKGAPLNGADALGAMRTMLWERQQGDSPNESDLAGGLVFARGVSARPTWVSLRPLAVTPALLGDTRLTTPEAFPRELGRVRRGLRFLMQLEAGGSVAHMYRNAERAAGGIRSSAWDQTCRVDATALGLILVCDTLRTLVQPAE